MKRRQKFNSGSTSNLQRRCFALAKAAEAEGWLVATGDKEKLNGKKVNEFLLIPEQAKANGKVEQDARYTDDIILYLKSRESTRIVIDTKSKPTAKLADYVLRRKLMLQVHKIEITEIHSLSEMQDLIAGLRNI